MEMLQDIHPVLGLAPVADALAGTVYSDIVKVGPFRNATFIVCKGVGDTGTSTLTIEACDDVTPSNVQAVPFKYRACTSGDSWGARTEATAAGFTTTAGENQMYALEVDGRGIETAKPTYGYARLKSVEVADDPVVGCIVIILGNPRMPGDAAIQTTQIT